MGESNGSEQSGRTGLAHALRWSRVEALIPHQREVAAPGVTRVLLVEDDEDYAALMERRLRSLLHQCVVAHVCTAAEAVETLDSKRFDLVMLDLSLPDTFGLESIKALEKHHLTTPIVVLTGSSDESLVSEALRMGAQDYLRKDEIDKRLLERAIRYSRERHQLISRLAQLAHHDQLTGLLNRALFEHEVEVALKRFARYPSNPFTLLFIDLDGFKSVNDQHGHRVGDRLLAAAAERVMRSVRDVDSVGRLGGDEFAVLLDRLSDRRQIDAVTSRCLNAIRQSYTVDGRELYVGASVGIAIGQPGDTAQSIIQRADAAMYRAKGAGGNAYRFA